MWGFGVDLSLSAQFWKIPHPGVSALLPCVRLLGCTCACSCRKPRQRFGKMISLELKKGPVLWVSMFLPHQISPQRCLRWMLCAGSQHNAQAACWALDALFWVFPKYKEEMNENLIVSTYAGITDRVELTPWLSFLLFYFKMWDFLLFLHVHINFCVSHCKTCFVSL